jgi:hypothetical protein
MKEQTAVEWLIKEIKNDSLVMAKSSKEWNQTFEQAKEMEKQQIIDAHQDGHSVTYTNYWAELYYNETYGGNNE